MKIQKIKDFFTKIKANRKEYNRFFLLVFALMLFADYLMFCFQADRNPLAVFPPFPVRDTRQQITVFLPDLDGTTVLEEKRRIDLSGSTDQNIRNILTAIARGSKYENTMPAVPVRILPRAIWIHGSECVIDLVYFYPPEEKTIIDGSEKLFREAVEKSITANIAGIEKVTIVNNGISGISLWQK